MAELGTEVMATHNYLLKMSLRLEGLVVKTTIKPLVGLLPDSYLVSLKIVNDKSKNVLNVSYA